ncbi:hypothetical protein [Deinococcus cellulosilyticus]|uniref:Uncharacterized protein n=1 Tax=Deinococcus cellulosilyticus (strain DSM 18568 / NBRC 106333 / KACC 11606 / 5516J-15) TaxID=1223518 RepID=A0A511N087_DEIC1|nr:hypothetical protein [Deinococcus cellulosilyticus]GEM46254.1 hypothetical protein DC3_18890 [Deinococcus cellulosilyticus NBRC 106333 = KACC 11606]
MTDAQTLPHYPLLAHVPVHLATERQLKMLGLTAQGICAVATVSTSAHPELPLYVIAEATCNFAPRVA